MTRAAVRRRRLTLLAVLVVVSAVPSGVLVFQSPASSTVSPPTPTPTPSAESPVRHRDQHRALGEADGDVPDGVTVFDEEIPAVANLDPDLLGAFRQAAAVAGGVGVEFHVNSGWRSPEYQNQLLRDAVSKYGSEAEGPLGGQA